MPVLPQHLVHGSRWLPFYGPAGVQMGQKLCDLGMCPHECVEHTRAHEGEANSRTQILFKQELPRLGARARVIHSRHGSVGKRKRLELFTLAVTATPPKPSYTRRSAAAKAPRSWVIAVPCSNNLATARLAIGCAPTLPVNNRRVPRASATAAARTPGSVAFSRPMTTPRGCFICTPMACKASRTGSTTFGSPAFSASQTANSKP